MRILRRREVQAKVGLAKTQLYEKIKAGQFPRPVRLGGRKAVGWIETELDAWIAARVAERDAQARNGGAHG